MGPCKRTCRWHHENSSLLQGSNACNSYTLPDYMLQVATTLWKFASIEGVATEDEDRSPPHRKPMSLARSLAKKCGSEPAMLQATNLSLRACYKRQYGQPQPKQGKAKGLLCPGSGGRSVQGQGGDADSYGIRCRVITPLQDNYDFP